MTGVLLAFVLSHAALPAQSPESAPAAAAESTEVAKQPASPPEPWYKTIPQNPWFGRVFSAAILASGVTLLLVGTTCFAVMMGLRTTSTLDNMSKEYRDNTVGLTTLAAATGLLLGGALTLGGIVGIILL